MLTSISHNAYLPSTILILCEQLQETLPHQRKPEAYITPVLIWMTQEWKRLKKVIADDIMAVVSDSLKLEAVEEIFISKQARRLVSTAILDHVHQYKVDASKRIADARKLAKADTVPKLIADRGNAVTIKLSKEGLQGVVDGLQFQKNFIDDMGRSVQKRVDRILQGRYGTKADLRSQINRTFRIDRDGILSDFHSDVRKIAQRTVDGKITPVQFQSEMKRSILRRYGEMYREGKGAPLEKWELDFVRREAESQTQYLSNFRNYMEGKQTIGEELTGRVTQRASLYAERGTAMFEAGHVGSLPDDVLLTWVLHPAEHCRTCPIFAANSPYTKMTLPGFPGEGFHLTECGTNCRCSLDVSELYAEI